MCQKLLSSPILTDTSVEPVDVGVDGSAGDADTEPRKLGHDDVHRRKSTWPAARKRLQGSVVQAAHAPRAGTGATIRAAIARRETLPT